VPALVGAPSCAPENFEHATKERLMTSTSKQATSAATQDKHSNRWYLSTAPIVRALIHLCVPMATAMIVTAVYNLINAGVVG
jgi:Na+-driven multidrug efflux pump